MKININSSGITLAISTIAIISMFIHDTQLDGAFKIAFSRLPSMSDVSNDSLRLHPTEHHIHAESNSLTSALSVLKFAQPSTKNNNEHDKKYIAKKSLTGTSNSNDYFWPSV